MAAFHFRPDKGSFRLRGIEEGLTEVDKLRGRLGLNIPCMLRVAMVRVADGPFDVAVGLVVGL